ncbi:hypothetical protein GCM10020295_69410 [Streptomyces cinereospinus]
MWANYGRPSPPRPALRAVPRPPALAGTTGKGWGMMGGVSHPYRPAPAAALRGLARLLRALPPSCGPVRLIGVDGHAGSGKTTFAGRLADALGGAPVLHLDDIASHDELFAWTPRLLGQVIEPLGRGETAHYAPYDWRGPPVRAAPPAAARAGDPGRGRRRRPARPAPASGAAAVAGDAQRGRLGAGGGPGTGRNSGTSGRGGSRRSGGISPRTPHGPSPTCWCRRCRRDTRCCRDPWERRTRTVR